MSRICTLLLFLVPAVASADDWPQWRGRDRDGHAHGAKLPKTWPEKPPKPLWTAKVGEGQASPAVADGRLFVMGRDDKGNEIVWCLDAATGKEVWKLSYACAYKPSADSAGQGPKSTPTVDGDRVFAFGVKGMLHCLRVKDGEVLWKHDLHKLYWGVAKDQWGDDAYSTCCGAAAAPLVYDKRVLLPVGGKKAGAVTAFERDTGKVAWHSPLKDRSSYASGMIAELAGKKQLVGFTGLRIGGFSLTDGSLLWGEPFEARYEQTILTPVIYKGKVIVGGEGRATFALEVVKKGDKLAAKEVWKNDRLKAYMTSPVAVKDHLYGLSERGELVCVNLEDGETAWGAGAFGSYGSILAAGDVLLVTSKNGELHVVEANPKKFSRKARWKVTGNDPVWGHLALVGSRLYVRDKTDVVCYDLLAK
jgi:outer membrane protein assembly factor BamB